MRLSIIIINWNTRALLHACLSSIEVREDGDDIETIVVDNGSTDGSPDMVETVFPWARLIRNAGNRGFAAANNQAIKVARGRDVLLLNSDTEIRGDVIEQSLAYFDTHADVGVLGCRVVHPDESLQLTCFRFPTLTDLFLVGSGLHRIPIPRLTGRDRMRWWKRDSERDVDVVSGCFMLVRGAAMDDAGLLDEDFFFYGEEADWCRRIHAAEWAIRFAPVGTIVHHGGASTLEQTQWRSLMHTEAIVRLIGKHRGRTAASMAWIILFGGTVLRGALWSIASLLKGAVGRAHARHYWSIAGRFHRVWSAV